MNKFEKGVSVLAVIAMVNPATIVSATTVNQQMQSDTTQNTAKSDTDTPLPTTEKRHISNMYVKPGSKYVAYSGKGTLDLNIYSSERTQYLGRIYVVMPKGLTVDGGLTAMKASVAQYTQIKPLNSDADSIIHNGTLSVRRLANTDKGREVYEIIPSDGAYVIAREYTETGGTHPAWLHVPIRSDDKSSGLKEVLFNANTKDDFDKDVLFIGAGDLKNITFDDYKPNGSLGKSSPYPLAKSVDVDLKGADDEYVRGIVYEEIQKSLQLYTPQVTDSYNVVDSYTKKSLINKPITTTGDSGTGYSRVGLVDTLATLKLDPTIYDEKSLAIDQGNLNGADEQGDIHDTNVIWAPLDAFTDNESPVLAGQTYTISVKQFAKDIAVNYEDETGNQIADSETLTGDVGDDYQAQQKAIDGYTFKEVTNQNATGTFSDQAQTVTYIYTKGAAQGADVTVNYQDKTGKQLASSEVLTGKVRDPYQAEQKQIDGYAFQEVVDQNATGTFSETPQTVTYIYAKVAGDVTVEYLDQNDKRISDDDGDTTETLTGYVGDDYQAIHKDIPGYVGTAGDSDQTGEFSDDAKTITYRYKQIAANVTVNYEDEAGNKVADFETLTGNVGEPYTTKEKSITGYIAKETPSNATGDFSETPQTVTYVYVKEAADVTVNYEDEAGNKIAKSETLTGAIGDKRIATQKKIDKYTAVKDEKEQTVELTADKQTITYHYTKDPVKAADVTVQYEDESGKQIAPTETLTGNIGDTYEIKEKTIAGYTLNTMTTKSKSITGTFSDKAQTITCHYTKDPVKAANITVSYQDADGNQIAAPKTLTGNIGDAYQTVQATIAGYTFKQVNGNAAGQFSDKPQTVTYVYTKDPAKTGNVTVNYQDVDGKQIAASKTLTGNVGTAYQAVQASIDGYTFKQVNGNAAGQFSDTTQTVTYVYTKNPVIAGNVTVNYQDEAGKQIAASETLTGNVDDSYHAVQKAITGYHFKAVTGEPDGRFTTSAQTITYVYTKDDPTTPIKTANQTVKYVDENGQTIASTEILTGNVGTPYHTTQKTIAGAPDGLFAANAPVVTYIYAKDPVQGANVTVNYQDADGNQIAASKTLTGNVGATYQAVQTPIAGYTYKKVSGNPTGTFGTAAQTVTYIYTKNPVQAGDVTVNYQDVDGNQIAGSQTLTGNVGTTYQAVQASITGYTYKQVVGNAAGQFSDKAQTVTYVYTKNATKPTQVIDPSGTKSDNQGVQSTKPTTPTSNLKTQPQPVQKTGAKHKQQLPQTSVAKVSSLLGIIGALLIATVGMVFKKRRN